MYRTPAGMNGSMAISATRVGQNRALTSCKTPAATVESAQAAVTGTPATTQKMQADRVSDSSSSSKRAIPSAVAETNLQRVPAATRKPVKDVARRPVRDIARRQVTNISRRLAIGSEVPESHGKVSAQGGLTERRKRRAADN